jgi:Zn-dependent protease with chaperone function
MDFFTSQERARRDTFRLLALFALAVLVTIAAVNLGLYLAMGGPLPNASGKGLRGDEVVSWEAAGVTSFAVLAVIVFGALYKMNQLRRGGHALAELLGGRLLLPASASAPERRLLNIVEEVAIAAGIAVPAVYVLDGEPAINAFAAGRTDDDSAIGVTVGALRLLTREELQGVVAHEVSHLLNGDSRLNLQLTGWVHGLFVISAIGRRAMRGRGWLLGAAIWAAGSVGVLLGKLVKSAVSRTREHLADASAVQFTRNPLGLAGALKKIGGHPDRGAVRDTHAEETSHFFFAHPLGRYSELFATHPPLWKRIKQLDPTFDGELPRPQMAEAARALASELGTARRSARAGRALGKVAEASQLAGGSDGVGVDAPSLARRDPGQLEGGHLRPAASGTRTLAITEAGAEFAQQLGGSARTSGAPLQRAAMLLDELPGNLREAAREPLHARAIVLALLLDPVPAVRQRQLAALANTGEPQLVTQVQRAAGWTDAAHVEARLPVLELTLPALHFLSAQQGQALQGAVRALIDTDPHLTPFEFALGFALSRHLSALFPRQAAPESAQAAPIAEEVSVVLSALAHHSGAAAEEAFEAGRVRLARYRVALLPAAECGLPRVERALARLAQTAPRLRRELVEVAAAVALADRRVVDAEAALVRGIADALGCPTPLALQPSRAAVGRGATPAAAR